MNNFGTSPSFRKHKRHDHRAHRSPALSGNQNISNTSYRECACGKGLACVGMTQAFRLLGDPRCYYVELPRFRENPPAYKYTFRNNLRAAYIRHLQKLNPNLNSADLDSTHERRYVALHHFHPAVVKAYYENPLTSGAARKHKVPISITEHELQELNMDILQEDRILSVTGAPTGGYYFCPSYAQEKAHEDLKLLIKAERAMREEKARRQQQAEQSSIPENIEISKPVTPPRDSSASTSSPISPDLRVTSNPQEPEKPDESAARVSGGASSKVTPAHAPVIVPDEDSSTEGVPASDAMQAVKEKEDDEDDNDDFRAVLFENETSEFDSLWAEDDDHAGGVNVGPPTKQRVDRIVEEDSEVDLGKPDIDIGEDSEKEKLVVSTEVGPDDTSESAKVKEDAGTPLSTKTPSSASKVPGRDTDHPWETPKYRRKSERPELTKRVSSSPAHFIDPTNSSSPKVEDAKDEIEANEGHHSEISDSLVMVNGISDECMVEPANPEATVAAAKPRASDAATAAQTSAAVISAAALMAMKSLDEIEGMPDGSQGQSGVDSSLLPANNDPPGWNSALTKSTVSTPPRIQRTIRESRSFEDNRSQASDESVGTSAVTLKHNFPGTDPTLRIQVHNDLIAWESKRRSDISTLLDFHGEQWQSLGKILREGLNEVEFAERLVSGFAKAGATFADSTQAVYDDKFLDDSGNTVNNSFLQNRLYKKRNAQEYSIDSQDPTTELGQSALLKSILDAQIEIANNFRESSSHIEQEILPELRELRHEIQGGVNEFEGLGDSIVAELKRSEIELKNIWDVFDAMVTGDLMEYTVHGSMHGGSQHGGSIHSSFGPSTGSLHGFLTPQGDGPIVSSVHSPMIKSTFRQLGAIEDGWLVEMFYRSAVAYQQAVFGIAENELNNLSKAIIHLEERRFRRLHEVMMAFVPRQRRLFTALPEPMTGVLDDLVGLRIDEETLQTLINESIRDRSHDHLKRGASHRSSIMNRSRITKSTEAEETEVEKIESAFGNPFKSSMVLLSKMVELQPGGLRGMVNTSWKAALVVVTSDGHFHVFLLPEEKAASANSPFEAFKCLYPEMELDSPVKWTRKVEISKSLTPNITMSLKESTFTVPKMQNRQLQIVEEQGGNNQGIGRNRFMKAMKAAADSQRGKRCTLRLPSASEVNEWVTLLERTKKILLSKDGTRKPSRFHF